MFSRILKTYVSYASYIYYALYPLYGKAEKAYLLLFSIYIENHKNKVE